MKDFGEVVEFHGHSCPGLALGYRVARAAMKEMALEGISEDEEVVAIVENNSCAVDAIQVVTGCTFGKGNLIFRDHGKQVYSFIKRPSGEAVRITIDFMPPPETDEEKEKWRRYAQGDRSEEILRTVYDRKAEKTKTILEASASDLLTVAKVDIPLPPEARIYQSVTCESCGEKVAEPRARVKEGKIVCIPCAELDNR